MKIFMLLITFIVITDVLASQKAVTDNGEVVLLRDDGTWSYQDKITDEAIKLSMNSKKFTSSKAATFNLKSNVNNFSFWIDPKKWSFKKSDQNGASEYNLSLKSGDLYGLVISEQLEVAVETLVDVAFENAKQVSSDMRVVHKEYRMVNGLKVIYMEMEGTIQGIKFKYLGNYHSDSSGSVQYLVYTGASLAEQYKDEISQYLNGLAEQ